MKILFSISNLKVGGAQIVALRLAKKLQERGHQVDIYDHFPDFRNEQLIKINFPMASIISISESSLARAIIWKINAILEKLSKPFFFNLLNSRKFKAVLKKGNYDILHSHMFESDKQVSSAMEVVPNIKFVSTMHGCYEEQIEYFGWDQCKNTFLDIFSKTEAVIYLTEKNIAFIKDLNLIKKPSLSKIYNGIDLNKEIQNKKKELNKKNKVIFGMVARGVPQKGWEEAIDAVIEIQETFHPQVELHLIGQSQYLEKLKKTFHNKNYIQFLGYQSNPSSFIKKFDIGLLPSYTSSESLPTSIIEYMAFNIPSIVSDAGEIPRMLEANKSSELAGVVIPINDSGISSALIANAMKKLISSPTFYQNLQSNCKKAVKKFNIEKSATEHIKIYEKLCQY